MAKVSVIMPAYNAEKYIREAIDSILDQTFRDFEFIIINDCSTDRTEEIILSYDDPRIIYLKNEKNLGVAETLNRGIEIARGEYIARMDADDISLPERFEKQADCLDSHEEIAVLGSNLELFTGDTILEIRCPSSNTEQMKVDLLFFCGLAHPSVMMRTAVIREFGGYDLAYEGLEDYELWCRVIEKYEITTLPEVLFRYRVHDTQVTRNPSPVFGSRMRRLKYRQLSQLGINPESLEGCAFLSYCLGDKVEALTDLSRFFELVLQKNEFIHIYESNILRNTFRSVLLKKCQGSDKGERKRLLEQSELIHKNDYYIFVLKRCFRKVLCGK